MEIEIISNDHKISNNELRCYFNDMTKFENNTVSLDFHLLYIKDQDYHLIQLLIKKEEMLKKENNLQKD